MEQAEFERKYRDKLRDRIAALETENEELRSRPVKRGAEDAAVE